MGTFTVKLHRILHAPPERVYRAFLDPGALVKWMAPHGFTGKVHHIDAKVGGTYKMSFTNFSTGTVHAFGGTYTEIIPNEKLVYIDVFDDPGLEGEMEVTITLKEVSVGTELRIVQAGVPDLIPEDACYLGWQESLQLFALLVEAEVPDGA
ncbi:SRPBCC family protein [bacterium]|nr:SRPBCC family protein [bacterium]